MRVHCPFLGNTFMPQHIVFKNQIMTFDSNLMGHLVTEIISEMSIALILLLYMLMFKLTRQNVKYIFMLQTMAGLRQS